MSLSALSPVPDDTGALDVLPGIGVGPAVEPVASITVSHVARYRMRTDRAGLDLRAGEAVLCAPYEPVELGMVVLVRCEVDGYTPGALIPAADVEYLEPVGPSSGPFVWGTPGVRD
ncbi:hypothetical protein AVL61_15635 [Kocuria rosea subsp. polaris]|uniref:Uncharacterized protein n=1 Tax=Kocuria rosea subsp. polaris TaxID=136273 RepID=A0A0W8IAW4_KOCRO|nr:hypothetical protein [Kocuria polaris]KUG57016.1 hypothetical protein AVL61_15635 [Kocuria polaris]